MTEKALWNEFITKHKINNTDYTAWAFGAEADLLAHLVATGEKPQHLLLISCMKQRMNHCLKQAITV